MRRIVLLSFLILFACGREVPRPRIPAVVRPQPRVIFIGLDGADWQMLDPLMGDGTMPNLARLVREGDRRVLTTIHPPLSPLVWTTEMTGVSPLEHRILDFTRFNPVTHRKEPITSDERAVPAIWNMATYGGKRAGVFGMWATYPAEEVNGTIVSDRLFSFQYDTEPPPGAVFPAADEAGARDTLRDVAARTGYDAMHTYFPWLTSGDYGRLAANANPFAHPVTSMRRIVIETEVLHRLAREWIARNRPDLAVVYFQGTDAVGHLFAPYYPPKIEGVSDADVARYSGVPNVYFRRIDAILGDYIALAQQNGSQIIIASDHGFVWGAGRTPMSSLAAATAGQWHRDQGIWLRWHPGVRLPAASLGAVKAADVCGILLDVLRLPKNLDDYRRRFRRARAAPPPPSDAADEQIAKLKALGYIGSGEPWTAPPGTTSTRTAASYDNEGLLLREAGRNDEAIAAFENALRIDPKSAAALWNLSDLLHRLRRDPQRADALLDAAIAIDPNQPTWLLYRGRYRLEKKDCRGARDDFGGAARLEPNNALIFTSLGTAELCLGNRDAANRAFQRSLQLDPNQPALRR